MSKDVSEQEAEDDTLKRESREKDGEECVLLEGSAYMTWEVTSWEAAMEFGKPNSWQLYVALDPLLLLVIYP